MDNTAIKIIELLSHNWLIVLTLVMCVPLAKLTINSIVQVKIARLQSLQKVVIQIEGSNFKKSLEIEANEMNFKELKSHILQIESPNLLTINNEKIIYNHSNTTDKKSA